MEERFGEESLGWSQILECWIIGNLIIKNFSARSCKINISLGLWALHQCAKWNVIEGGLEALVGCFRICEKGKEDPNLAGKMPLRKEQDWAKGLKSLN